ncbi:Part of AAA domain-containing protein [Pseudonocardia thermophila]|uniref:Part of AAA domain-containing protein n=1 Tax=Pseudonocardia thermophila TaxID=1848 RepID=A0A1M6QZY1_PSETH|nr:DUF3320 domain-containing protein [Pseudonocardia thermophila]SHK25733.1 Part of AAA domain-containing protein [Pseudonocardia thermophila]
MSTDIVSEEQAWLVREAVRSWRDGLVNLTRSNRLLNFPVRKTSAVRIMDPQPAEVVRRLGAGEAFTFRGAAVEMSKEPLPGPTPENRRIAVLRSPMPHKDMASTLRSLMRKSHQEYLDRGLRILYLAIGTLEWADETGTAFSSPLLLVPVELENTGPRQLPLLRGTEDDPLINPALTLKLGEMGIELPGLGSEAADEIVDPATVRARIETAVAGKRGWRVEDGVVLSYFTFAKEAMYRDLLENEEIIAAHPVVTALAAGGRGVPVGDFGFDEIADSDIDRVVPADRIPLVLDADSSQRACIAAAVEGRSFVMDGPPGTGKSQTIANMIGALLHAGRTVLFVSEKAAALDVVRDRLTEVGLGAYLLELHSSKATRKEVAAELGRALKTRPVARAGLSDSDREGLLERQEKLNRYVAAMNEPRAPLNVSLHSVIGRLSGLAEVPSAPRMALPVRDLTPQVFGEIMRTAEDLARAWRPAEQGSTYLWRGVRPVHAIPARLLAAERSLDDLLAVLETNAPVVEAFGFGSLADGERLAALLEHYAARPAVPARWITDATAAEITGVVDRLTDGIRTVHERRGHVALEAGAPWERIPRADGAVEEALRLLDGMAPPALEVDELTGDALDALLDRLRNDVWLLGKTQAELADIAAVLQLPVPSSFPEIDQLLSVAAIANEQDRPEAGWLSPRGRAVARQAVSDLVNRRAALDAAEEAARRFYEDSALEADAAGLEERFRTQHTGLRRMGGAYRRDKAAVAAFTKDGVSPADAHKNLGLVVEWQRALAAWNDVVPLYRRDLGSYFAGRDTDLDRVSRAIDRADAIAARFPRADLTGVAAHLTAGVTPAPRLVSAVRAAASALGAWRTALHQVIDVGPGPQLLGLSLAEVIAWLDRHITALGTVREVVGRLESVTGRPWTVRGTRTVLALRRMADEAFTAFERDAEQYRRELGELYQGLETDLGALRAAAGWVIELQRQAGGPLTTAQVEALRHGVAPDVVRARVSAWRAKRTDVVECFESFRHAELHDELDRAEEARALLRELQDDPGGPLEWRAYQKALETLRKHGLEATVDFCVRERIPQDRFRDVVEKAVLTEWVEHVMGTDPDLQPMRAQDRDALVEEFRVLDRRIVDTAVGSIIEACNRRRPRSVLGEQAAVITREAEKKRKHMPVRELIARTRDVTQAIKPCFMMSPLAVSQFLPPDLRFDVVIFDEASQVAPMDAINCIYRGNALITAGDAKQLPPTSFFALSGDESDEWDEGADDAQDFESVLDLAKSSGAFKSLTLKWHYRSRHESLIAFSNHFFYGGELITFPGADDEGPDVGIEFIPVKGVYRRGGARDNPIEARTVAERVLHHFDTRPGKSVGVVTFSETQASAVEAAVEEARRERPDLDRYFTENRLDGFFVKALESVQGDERDVMIFSIGYGPDEVGKIHMNFGPLNKPGGWRRLNVAITRARYRNEIVSSISAGDIVTSANENLMHLRRYLDFAERGKAALALDTSAGGDAESPFEESVIRTIRSWGYEVTPQVGTAGYRIDIAVHHPDKPGVYVLGVECDGASYHSSRVARDRDRLRDQVLTGLGWTLHRIWSTAWYHDRAGAERRLREAIETAIQAPVRGLLGGGGGERPTSAVPVELEEIDYSMAPDWTEPYTIAEIGPRPLFCELHEPAAEPAMRKAVVEIVSVEGPVHIDVVRQRLRERWRIGQIGSRIRERLDSAIRMSGVVREGDFLHEYGNGTVRVRTPVEDCRRPVDHVHPTELALALENLVRDAGAISEADAMVNVARIFGWGRIGAGIQARLTSIVDTLVEQGRLRRAEGELSAEAAR